MRRRLPTLLTVAAVAGAYAWFRRDMSEARSRLSGRAQAIDTAAGVLEYAALGEGEPTLVIHGAGGGFDQALDFAGVLAEHDRRVIAPSRFGYLGSAMPAQASPEAQADAFAALLDRLDVEAVDVVAISAGVWSALQFAIRHPQRCRKLVLLVPGAPLPPGVENQGGALFRAMIASDAVSWAVVKLTSLVPGAASRAMLGVDPAIVRAAPSAELSRLREIMAHLLPMAPRFAGMQFDIATASAPPAEHLTQIACPVLAISAEDDPFGTAVRARSIAERVKNGRAVVYPSGGHALVGRYESAVEAVVAFLDAPIEG